MLRQGQVDVNTQAAASPRMRLNVGDPVPWFYGHTTHNPRYCFDTVAGRYVILSFFGSASQSHGQEILTWVRREKARFDDVNLAFFGISADPADESSERLIERVPGIRFFLDFDHKLARLYGLAGDEHAYAGTTFVLDPLLRIIAKIPMATSAQHIDELHRVVSALPKVQSASPAQAQAPVLIVEGIFEPQLCQRLIDYFKAQGGRDSGFMRDVNGRTVELLDSQHKRRTDCVVEDERLKQICMLRVRQRLVPLIERAFQFRATRMERYIVACYDSASSGHFRAHRDNTTKGTAHRRFAASIFLNTGEYEGGHLRFPEFGSQLYEVPTGGAVVFSCSLLHEATTVTKGERYAFLPFLYDDAAATIRQRNQQYLGGQPATDDRRDT